MVFVQWLMYLFLQKNVPLYLYIQVYVRVFTIRSNTINLALCNSKRTDGLGLSSINGNAAKLFHCPPSFEDLSNKIAVMIPVQIPQGAAVRNEWKNPCDII